MTTLAAIAAVAAAWVSGSPLEEPRTEVAVAPLQGRIVVVGGFLASGGNSRRVDSYDPARDTWARLPDLPVSVDHAAAASWRGRIVVVGGYGADRAPLRAAFLYDGRRWRRLPAPPEERAAAARRRNRRTAACGWSAVERALGSRRARCRSTCGHSDGASSAARGPASISPRPRWAAVSTPSGDGSPG